ncbi:MAG: flagellar motor switch protein FliG [Firmicutes bacterium]|nr:flagellar motor switch protein FliG [Bacillota bacterium]
MSKRLTSNLTGKQKAAILLVALGPEISAEIFKHLTESEIENLTLELANIRKVDPDLRQKVLEEFSQLYQAQEYIAQGGIEYAKEVLEKALGARRANDIIEKLTETLQIRPFDFARNTDPTQLVNFIQNEHPQTIALVLSYLNPDQAGIILSSLPPEKQVDIAKRIATMDRTSPDVLTELENLLEKKISTFMTQGYMTAGGIDSVVQILNRVDRATEKTILETLSEEDPELAEEIKRRMFVFEDIIVLDDRAIQQVLREVDTKDLALALKTASEEVAERIYKNMSKRAAEMLKEDIQYMGPVRLRDAEDAQQRIVNVIRRLEEAGEIIIARGGGDEIIV